MGGFKVQRDQERLISDALNVQEAGAFSVVLEGIPSDIAAMITEKLTIPTIGIGAGSDCDGQILVLHDLLGLHDRHLPKFVKQFADLKSAAMAGIEGYRDEVRNQTFPGQEHGYK
jgi:3-methyl-2-oxobutanoate hydroxymethyltransferase